MHLHRLLTPKFQPMQSNPDSEIFQKQCAYTNIANQRKQLAYKDSLLVSNKNIFNFHMHGKFNTSQQNHPSEFRSNSVVSHPNSILEFHHKPLVRPAHAQPKTVKPTSQTPSLTNVPNTQHDQLKPIHNQPKAHSIQPQLSQSIITIPVLTAGAWTVYQGDG